MTEAPLVSIVIRSMGRPCLANAIASVAYQTHRPLELIVVDATGGSHPPMPALPTLTRARLVSVGRKLVRPAAANVGIDHAEGSWIGFLDDDDFFEDMHVARLLERGMRADRPRLVHGQLWGLDRFHRITQQRYTRVNPLIMYFNCQIGAMSCLIHRSLIDDGLRLDETLETSEDWDFWLRLLPHTPFATVREPTHFYFAEAGTSGTGIGLNSHGRNDHPRFHGMVQARYERDREEAWAAHFDRLREGIDMLNAGRPESAVAFFGRMMRAHPDEPNAVYLKAQAHLHAGQLQMARHEFKQAIALNMDAADYYLGLGDTCALLGNDGEARTAYANAAHYNPALRDTIALRVERLSVGAAPQQSMLPPGGTPSRNAACPCGSGLRYKQCHGKVTAAADIASFPNPDLVEAERRRALALAVEGSNRRARAALQSVLRQAPDDIEALHAHALLTWDAGDIVAAGLEIARAASLAPLDTQIAENHAKIRSAAFEHEHSRSAITRLQAMVGSASGRSLPGPVAPGTAVHLISPFESAHGGTEAHALEVARLLAPAAPVRLWSTNQEIPDTLAAQGVACIDPARGHFPRDGVFVLFGSWQLPPLWVAEANPARLLVVHNVDNVAALLELVEALLAHTALPVELLMPSEVFREHSRLPGTAYTTPIDLQRFTPRHEGMSRERFTVGRLSRNVHVKYHPDDADLARRLVAEGVRVRLMGATVLRRHFQPAAPTPGLELLPSGSEDAAAFLQSLDAFYYRTSPHWLETAGRVVAEAMATGLPVVCARNVGLAELITHGVDGFVFEPDDDDALLSHLLALRDDPHLRRAMSSAARASAERTFGPNLAIAVRRAYLGY